MRLTSFFLAALAGTALALPTMIKTTAGGPEITALPSNTTGLLNGLEGHGAAAFAAAAIGVETKVIDAAAKADLVAWISGVNVKLDASVLAAIKGWCEGSVDVLPLDIIAEVAGYVPVAVSIAAEAGLSVDVSGIISGLVSGGVALIADVQVELQAFIKSNININVKSLAALEVCAFGGVVESLSAEVKAALIAYLKAPTCALDVALKAAVQLWADAQIGRDVVAIGKLSKTASISTDVGASIAKLVDANGIVTASTIASLKAWVDAQVNLDAKTKAALDLCTKAKAAATLDVDNVLSLSKWLVSAELDPQLKAVLLVWLHSRITPDLSTTLTHLTPADIAALSAWIKGDIAAELSTTVKSAIALAISAESAVYVTVDAIAELAGLVVRLVDVQIDPSIELIIIKWLTGTSGISGTLPTIPTVSGLPIPSTIPTIPKVSGLPIPSTIPTIPKVSGLPIPSTIPTIPKVSGLPIPSNIPTIPKDFGLPTLSTDPKALPLPSASGFVTLAAPSATLVPSGASSLGSCSR
jgi:hypothetical protein